MSYLKKIYNILNDGLYTQWLFSTSRITNLFNKYFPPYLRYLRGLAFCSTMPFIVLSYFFAYNAITSSLYFFLVLISILNQWPVLFLFLLDLPVTTGIFSILVMNPKSRPWIYSILGEDNAKFYLGNPGSKGLKTAGRLGGLSIAAVAASTGVEMGQDYANDLAARRYWKTTTELGLPGDMDKFQSFYDRKNVLSSISTNQISNLIKAVKKG